MQQLFRKAGVRIAQFIRSHLGDAKSWQKSLDLLGRYLLMRGAVALRIRSLESERDEYKRNWNNRSDAWKDREEELRRILSLEKDKQISQIKAEYESYTDLLEQKLTRTRTRES
jgi:hypothetical protein